MNPTPAHTHEYLCSTIIRLPVIIRPVYHMNTIVSPGPGAPVVYRKGALIKIVIVQLT